MGMVEKEMRGLLDVLVCLFPNSFSYGVLANIGSGAVPGGGVFFPQME